MPIVVLVLLLLAPSAALTAGWPTFRHDPLRSGRADVPGPAAPAILDGWPLAIAPAGSPTVGVDGVVYIGSFDRRLYAINPDGVIRWAFETGAFVSSSPAIGPDGTIYVGSEDGRLYAVSPDGSRRWAFATGGDVLSSPAVGPDGTVYVGSGDGRLYAVGADGLERWAWEAGDPIFSSPVIGPDNSVYIGSSNGRLHALAPDGTPRWSVALEDGPVVLPAFDPGGSIYAMSGGSLHAVGPGGTLRWALEAGYGWPAVGSDGTIYAGSREGLVALGPDGARRWTSRSRQGISSVVAIGGDGTIYAVTDALEAFENRLYAIGPDGARRWAVPITWPHDSAAIGPEGRLYIGSSDGKLYAFGPGSASYNAMRRALVRFTGRLQTDRATIARALARGCVPCLGRPLADLRAELAGVRRSIGAVRPESAATRRARRAALAAAHPLGRALAALEQGRRAGAGRGALVRAGRRYEVLLARAERPLRLAGRLLHL